MNAPNTWSYDDETEANYTVASSRRDQNRQERMGHHAFERHSARPSSSANGMHRRRNHRHSC
jgi:hypothetical protein